MSGNPYLRFLPVRLRASAGLAPQTSWWQWRDHRVHLSRAVRPDSPVRLLVIHGAGGHSGALWPIAALLAAEGLEVCAVDLPLYGRTRSARPNEVRYADWLSLLVDLAEAEQDDRPLILFGASIGGLLALEVASRSEQVTAVAATCLLDPADWRARVVMTRFGPLGVLGRPLAGLVGRRLGRLMIPIGTVANLRRMSRDRELAGLCAADPLGGAAKVPLGFLASFMRHSHRRPESIVTPLTLLHPADDDWTPTALSLRVLQRVAGQTDFRSLRNCGHFPIEEPGVDDLIDAVLSLARRYGEQPSTEDPVDTSS